MWIRGQGGGKGGTNGEGSMGTYTLSHVKHRAGGDLAYASGSSNRGSVTPTGMGREVQRERTHVCRWLVHVDAAETNTVCKAITLPLNVNFKKIRNEVILELDVFED